MAEAVEAVRAIPDKHRRFTRSASYLRRVYHIDDSLLHELLDAGFPSLGRGEQQRFDGLDAANICLRLGLPSPYRVAMRWWLTSLNEGERHPARICTLQISPADSADRMGPAEGWSLDRRVVASAVPGSITEMNPGKFRLDVRLCRAQGSLNHPSFQPIINEVLKLKYHMIPRSLQWDLGFAAETGLADCELATHLLITRATEVGLSARRAEGFLLVAPFAVWHAWAEFQADGTWFAADPFLLKALAAWGIVDPAEWPPTRSPHAVLWRLGSGRFRPLRRWDRAVPTSVIVLSSRPEA